MNRRDLNHPAPFRPITVAPGSPHRPRDLKRQLTDGTVEFLTPGGGVIRTGPAANDRGPVVLPTGRCA